MVEASAKHNRFAGESTMPTIIDVDSHFEPGDDWLEPYPNLKARLPKL
jgi:hypothetical protein